MWGTQDPTFPSPPLDSTNLDSYTTFKTEITNLTYLRSPHNQQPHIRENPSID